MWRGKGLKRVDYEKAARAAERLSIRLGKGWLPHVWENLGWHWEVVRGLDPNDVWNGSGLVVRHRKHDNTYEVELRQQTEAGFDQFFAIASTPEDAIGQVRQDVRTYICRLEGLLRETI
jgi:hypothetical protein